jgi:hypothetical protein
LDQTKAWNHEWHEATMDYSIEIFLCLMKNLFFSSSVREFGEHQAQKGPTSLPLDNKTSVMIIVGKYFKNPKSFIMWYYH